MDMKPTPEVLKSVIEKGKNELNRDNVGLLMSSFSAGLDIGFGPLLMGVFLTLAASGFGDLTTELLLATAYSVGFIFVILGRSELFTEHTTLAVMPVIDGQASVNQLFKLWGIVYVGNIIGGIVFTGLAVLLMPGLGVVTPEAFETIGLKLITHPPHSIAGNVEVLFGLLTSSDIGFMDYLLFLVMATIGNILGGTIFVGLLKYGHVIRGAK